MFSDLCLSGIGGQDDIRNVQPVHQAAGNFPLEGMLRFILYAGLPAPADHKQDRDPVNLRIQQRRDRVHRIPDPAVLHINHTGSSASKIMSRAQSHGSTFIRADKEIPVHFTGRLKRITQRFKQRIRNTRIKADFQFLTDHLKK